MIILLVQTTMLVRKRNQKDKTQNYYAQISILAAMKKGWLILVIALLMVACKYDEGNSSVNVDGKFTVSVPNFMKKTNRLSPGSPFQYENQFRTIYTIGQIDKAKNKQNFDDYSKTILNDFGQKLQDIEISQIDSLTNVDGLPAKKFEIWGTIDDEKVFYYLLTVNASPHYYQLCAWTLERRYEAYGKEVKSIVNSIKISR